MQAYERRAVLCPNCGRRTKTKVLPITEMKHFPLWCQWCKTETIIDIQPDLRGRATSK